MMDTGNRLNKAVFVFLRSLTNTKLSTMEGVMPRAIASDPYRSFQFRVVIHGEDALDRDFYAGFTTITLPEYQVAIVEYKASLQKLPRKYSGQATVTDVTFSHGLMKGESPFYRWAQRTQSSNILTEANYKRDINIYHMHHDGSFREYKLFNCIPVNFKPGSDLDASNSDISVEEFTIAIEDFEIEETKV